MLSGNNGWLAFANPANQLHRVFPDVVLAELAVCRECLDVWCDLKWAQAFRATWIIDWLAVQLCANNRPLLTKVAWLSKFGNHSSKGSVDEREDIVTEVCKDNGVVICIAVIHLTLEFALLDANAAHRGNALHRSENAGKRMQSVDGHVVEWAAAGLAPIPGWIDICQRAVACTNGLAFVVAAECGTGDGPAKLAELAGEDGFADFMVGWTEHLPRGCNDVYSLCGCTRDEIGCFATGHCHRFVEMDMLAGFDCLDALFVVQANRGADDNGINAWVSKDFIFGTVGFRNAVFCSGGFGAAINRVAACSDMCDALHVLKDKVVQGSTDSN